MSKQKQTKIKTKYARIKERAKQRVEVIEFDQKVFEKFQARQMRFLSFFKRHFTEIFQKSIPQSPLCIKKEIVKE